MSRFGDFSLLEDLGKSAVADRYKAVHAVQGGPFFLKVYRRLDPRFHPELKERGDRLIGKTHQNLAPHLGHGDVDGVPFTVSPWLDGIDLPDLQASLKDRRVNITLDHCVLILVDLSRAVFALHQLAPTATGSRLAHGDVSVSHVRLGPDGQVWLTGLTTPRGLEPGRLPEARFDLAGVGALLYDLVPLLRGGAARPPLPTPLDRVIRRALGIGPTSEHLLPAEFADRLVEVAEALKLGADRAQFVDVVRRTIRAVEKKLLENSGRVASAAAPAAGAPRPQGRAGPGAADGIPELVPVNAPTTGNRPAPTMPTLEPLRAGPPPAGPPAGPPFGARPLPELLPVAPRVGPSGQPFAPAMVPAAAPLSSPPRSAASVAAPVSPFAPAVPPMLAPMLEPMFAPPAHAAPPLSGPAPVSSPRFPGSPAPGPLRPGSPAPGPLGPLGPGSPAPGPLGPGAAAVPASAPRPATMPLMPLSAVADALAPLTARSSGLPLQGGAGPAPLSPSMATLPPLPPDLAQGLDAAPRPRSRSQFFSDDVDAGAGKPTRPALPADEPTPMPPSPFGGPQVATPPKPAPSPFLKDDTDPDAVRPARIEAQKALPAVLALLQAGAVTAEQVERAANEQVQKGGRTLEILVAHGAIDDMTVAQVLARSTNRPIIAASQPSMGDAAPIVVKDTALLRRLPQTYALARRLLPLAVNPGVAGGTLVLAVADPFEQKVIDEVKGLLHASFVDVRVAPRKVLTEATIAAFAQLHGTSGGVEAGGPRVLLAVQDETKAQKLGDRLAQEGMQVELCVDGHNARQILATRPPQAVICTHDLPGLDGRALLLFLRAQEAGADLPFFMLGPRGDDDLIARVLDLGADDFFGEPLRLDVVLAKLRRAIDKGKRGANVEVSSPGRAAPPPAPVAAAPPPLPKKKPTEKAPAAPPPSGMGEFDFAELPDLPPEFEGAGLVDVPAMPTGVMGTLRQMALPEIVQSLEMGRKTASVDIVPADGEKGMIGFQGGAIRYAECGSLLGDQAFFALMRHKEGFFRIHYGDAPPSLNIDSPTTFLLLEAMRLMDEEGMS